MKESLLAERDHCAKQMHMAVRATVSAIEDHLTARGEFALATAKLVGAEIMQTEAASEAALVALSRGASWASFIICKHHINLG